MGEGCREIFSPLSLQTPPPNLLARTCPPALSSGASVDSLGSVSFLEGFWEGASGENGKEGSEMEAQPLILGVGEQASF